MLLLIKVKVGVNLHTIAGRVEKMGKLHVNVKFSSASSCPLEVDSSSSVRSLKNCVSSKTGIAEGDLHLILAGKVLNDNQTLDVSYWQLILYPPPPPDTPIYFVSMGYSIVLVMFSTALLEKISVSCTAQIFYILRDIKFSHKLDLKISGKKFNLGKNQLLKMYQFYQCMFIKTKFLLDKKFDLLTYRFSRPVLPIVRLSTLGITLGSQWVKIGGLWRPVIKS